MFVRLRRLRLKLRDSSKSRGTATVMDGVVDQVSSISTHHFEVCDET